MAMNRDLAPRMLAPDMLSATAAPPVVHEHGMMAAPAPIAAPSPFGAIGGSAVTPRFALNVLRRWWKLSVVLGAVLAAIAGVIAYMTYIPQYQSVTWLKLNPRTWVLTPDEIDRRVFINTQRELVRSPPILAEALAKPGVASLPIFDGVDDPINWLAGRIAARSVGDSDLFTISLESRYKDSVAKVVNAVREAYIANINNETLKSNDTNLTALERERQRRFSDIENDKNRLGILRQELDEKGGANVKINDEDEIRLKTLADDLRKQLSSVEVEIMTKTAELNGLERAIGDPSSIKIEPKALEEHVDADPTVAALYEQRDAEAKKMADLNKFATKEGSIVATKIKAYAANIAKLEEKIDETRKAVRPEIEKHLLSEARKHREELLGVTRKKLEADQNKLEALTQQYKKAQEDALNAGQTTLAIEFLKDDIERKVDVFQKIVDRIEAIRTESTRLPQVQLLLEAPEPIEPIGRGPLTQGLIVAGVAFLFPFAGFFLWELKSRRVGDVDDVREATNLRVIGEISTLPVRTKFMPGSSKKFEESLTRFEESIDYLRTSILIARHQRHLQSLVVCSAASREGKSTVAAHLSSSLARGIGGRVLLVDADMRRPHLHRLLDQDPANGLVDYLAGRIEIDAVIRSTWVDRLDFVASGILDTPVGVLLASDRFERFLREAEKHYEFIIIDVPPILPVSEGLVIAKAADGAIYCSLRDVSTFSNAARACDKLRGAGVHMIGAVFNGVPSREYGASGYYYYRIPVATSAADAMDPN